jgi:hypothetical protein
VKSFPKKPAKILKSSSERCVLSCFQASLLSSSIVSLFAGCISCSDCVPCQLLHCPGVAGIQTQPPPRCSEQLEYYEAHEYKVPPIIHGSFEILEMFDFDVGR